MLSRDYSKSNMFSMFFLIIILVVYFFPSVAMGRTSFSHLVKLENATVDEQFNHLKVVLSFRGRPSVRKVAGASKNLVVYDFYPAVYPEIRSESIVSLDFASSVVIAQNDNRTVRIAVRTDGTQIKFASGLTQGEDGITLYTLDFASTGVPEETIHGYLSYKSPKQSAEKWKEYVSPAELEADSGTAVTKGKESFIEALSRSLESLRKTNRELGLSPEGYAASSEESACSAASGTPFRGRIWTVVLDPGHGGKDPGALGTNLQEKDIVLATAYDVVRELNRIPFIKVVMTRTKDEFVKLRDRSALAEQSNADLFVSLHCNSSPKAKSSGFEVYTLSRDGASDEVAHEVARKENSVLQLENNGAEIESTPMLNQILCSMIMTDTINQSVLLAGFIGKEAKKISSLNYRGHKNANFFVLRSLKIPAVLVEMGFVSNAAEEKRMAQKKWRKTMASRVAGGIRNYLNHVMMREGEFEDLVTCDYYVKKGDTLGSIARRYKTSVSNIVRLNSIADGNSIIPGQSLKVPGDPVANLLWETSH